MPPEPETEWTIVARVVTTHGRRGEVDAELWTDFPERFRPGCRLWLSSGNEAAAQDFVLESFRMHKGRALLKLRGVEDLSEAERWRGSLIRVPRSERQPLPPSAVYLSDLIGCAVCDGGQFLGTVAGWEHTGAVPLLCVRSAEGEILIPFAAEICEPPDLDKKEIRVRLPEGLAELNRGQKPPPRPSSEKRPQHKPRT